MLFRYQDFLTRVTAFLRNFTGIFEKNKLFINLSIGYVKNPIFMLTMDINLLFKYLLDIC